MAYLRSWFILGFGELSMEKIRVLHIGDELNWRGGENQVQLLINHSSDKVDHFIAYPKSSRGFKRFQGYQQILGFAGRRLNGRNLFQITRFCTEHKIQVLDAQSSGGHSVALAVKLLMPSLKLVVHRRVDNPIKKRWRTKSKYFHKNVNAYVAISNKIKNILLGYGIDSQKVHTIHSGVKLYETTIQEKIACKVKLLSSLGVQKDIFVIGNASAFTPQKDYPTLIRALAILKEKNKSFVGIFAGDGPDMDACKSLVKSLGLSDHIHFLGYRNDIKDVLKSFDILAVPSANEGLGTLIIDGVCAGCKIVASNVGGIPEIIIPKQTGWLVEPHSPKELATVCIERISDTDHPYQVTAMDHVKKFFCAKKMADGNTALYQELLKAPAG